MSQARWVFIGERPSRRAVAIGATWQNGKLAGATLRAALVAAGIDPAQQRYLNLWDTPDGRDCAPRLTEIQRLVAEGAQIVGMGQIVCRQLAREGIPHRALIHPAARGTIRRTGRYQAHVQQVLGVESCPPERNVA